MSYSNINITHNGKILKPHRLLPNYPKSIFDKCESFNDSVMIKRFDYLGYKNNSINSYKKNYLSKGLIKIKKGETLFFETYISLPLNKKRNTYYDLSKNKKYLFNITINSDTTNIKKYLTWPQLKNIEENNYKLFHGTIISENSVPIVFVD